MGTETRYTESIKWINKVYLYIQSENKIRNSQYNFDLWISTLPITVTAIV